MVENFGGNLFWQIGRFENNLLLFQPSNFTYTDHRRQLYLRNLSNSLPTKISGYSVYMIVQLSNKRLSSISDYINSGSNYGNTTY